MLSQRWPPWAVALLAVIMLLVTLAAVTGAWHGSRRAAPRATVPNTGEDYPGAVTGISPEAGPVAAMRVCVTRYGFCPVAAARAGDPCGCPHALRGSVPGLVERIGGKLSTGSVDDWPADDADDPLSPLGTLHGP